jgi:hypothetical protein
MRPSFEQCPLMARSRRAELSGARPLSGRPRRFFRCMPFSAYDPKRTLAIILSWRGSMSTSVAAADSNAEALTSHRTAARAAPLRRRGDANDVEAGLDCSRAARRPDGRVAPRDQRIVIIMAAATTAIMRPAMSATCIGRPSM